MATKPRTGSKTKSSASKKSVQKKTAPKTAAKAKTSAKKPPQKPKAAKKSAPKKPVSAVKKTKPGTTAKPKPATVVKTQKKAPVVREEIKVTETSKAFESKFDEIARTTALPKQGKKTNAFAKIIVAVIIIVIIVLIYLFYPREKTSTVKEVTKTQEQTQIPVKEEVKPEAETAVEDTADGSIYTVKYKDQLTEISKEFYGNHIDWKRIYEANKDKINDPNLIFPGQKLKIPK